MPKRKKPGRPSYRDKAKLPKYASHKIKVQREYDRSVQERLPTHVARGAATNEECQSAAGGFLQRVQRTRWSNAWLARRMHTDEPEGIEDLVWMHTEW